MTNLQERLEMPIEDRLNSPDPEERAEALRVLSNPSAAYRERNLRDAVRTEAVGAGDASFTDFFRSLNDPIGTLKIVAAGTVKEALTAPLESILSFPILNITKVDEWLGRVNEGIVDWQEESGLRAGMTVDEIATMKLTGDLIGFTGAAVASWGLASTLLRLGGKTKAVGAAATRIPQLLANPQTRAPGVRAAAALLEKSSELGRRFPHLSGGLLTEGLAGAIYEGILTKPEFGESRVNNALWGAPAFMAGRLLFNIPAQTIATGTNHLAVRSQTYREMKAKASKVFSPFLFKNLKNSRADLMAAYSEWDQILGSPKAFGQLMDGDPNRAGLLTALRETQIARGHTRGAFVYAYDGVETGIMGELSRLREMFPELTLQHVKNGYTGLTEVHFSPKVQKGGLALNKQQMSDIKEMGMYIGQQVRGEGFEGVAAKFHKKLGPLRVLVADPLGNTQWVARDALTTVFGAAENPGWKGLPNINELYEIFQETVNGTRKSVQAAGMDLTVPQKEALAKAGQLKIDLDERTAKFLPGTVTHPEHAGLVNYLTPDQDDILMALRDDLVDVAEDLAKVDPETPEALALMQEASELQAQVTQLETLGGIRFADELAEDGAEVILKPNFGDTPLGLMFDDFADGIKLPSGGEREALKAEFISRYTREAIEFVDDDARELFKGVMDEYYKRLEEEGLSLENLAAMKGFHLFSDHTGEKFMLREITSGREFFSRNADEVRGALGAIVRDSPELSGIALPGLGPMFKRTYKPLRNDLIKSVDEYQIGGLLNPTRLSKIRPIQSILASIEEATGVPFFRLAREIDDRFTVTQIEAEPANRVLEQISKKWGKIVRGRQSNREELMNTFAMIYDEFPEGAIEGVTKAEVTALLKSRGVKSELIEIVEMFDDVGQIITPQLNKMVQNATGRQFLPYYARKFLQQTRATEGMLIESPNPKNAANEFEAQIVRFFKALNGKKQVTNVLDDNPVIVMDSFIKELYMRESTRPLLGQWKGLMNMKVKDLNSLQKTQYATRHNLTQAQLDEQLESYVINPATRTLLTSFHDHYSFNSKKQYEGFKNFMNGVLRMLNVEVSDELIDEYIRLSSSLMYGSTLGFRALPIMANSLQVDFQGLPRFGTRNYTNALRKSMSYEGYKEAIEAAGIRPNVKSVRFAEGDYIQELTDNAVRQILPGNISSTVDYIARGLVKGGRWTEDKVVSLGLAPFSSMDDFNRARAYHWQKLEIEQTWGDFAAKYGDDFIQDAVAREKFSKRALMGFRDAKKNLFFDKLKYEGQESAFRYISKQAADDINFIFGRYLGPQMLQEGWGRLFGMFGSWPLWLVDGGVEIVKNTSFPQKILMGARFASVTAAYSLVAEEYDVDPWRFHPFSAVTWAGGPAVDILGQSLGFFKASTTAKPAIAYNIVKDTGLKLMPGSVAAQEWSRSMVRAGGHWSRPEDWMPNVNKDYLLTALMFGRPDTDEPTEYEGLLSYEGFTGERKAERRTYGSSEYRNVGDIQHIIPEKIWRLIDNPLNQGDAKQFFESDPGDLELREYVNLLNGLPKDAYSR